ncbi:MAG: hypothetical protein GXP43_02400 [bacterium]|nr:hypothetical protein [bacterium]
MKLYQNFLYFWGLLILVFIPLYPKFPLFSLPGTYVAVRLEDFVILAAAILIIPRLFRLLSSQTHRNHVIAPVCLFLFIGLIAALKSIFVYQITPAHLTLLHYFRRVEYFIPLFFFLIIPLNRSGFKKYLLAIFTTTFLVDVYAFGQKVWQWPVISTMNEEFSKGILLKLTWLARVSSTFAGHYDLAIFLVVILNLALGFYLTFIRASKAKAVFWLWWFFTFYILVLTASRVSIATFFITIPLFLLFNRKIKLAVVVLSLALLISLQSNNLNQRFYSLLPAPVQIKLAQLKTTVKTNKQQIISFSFSLTQKPSFQTISPTPTPTPAPRPPLALNNRRLTHQLPKPKTFQPAANQNQSPASPSSQPIASPSGQTATAAAHFAFPTPEPIAAAAARSSQIRFKVEWPRAIRAFAKNPLIGTGYASLGLATDNDYLRLLGETGMLGFVAFFLIIINLTYLIIKKNRLTPLTLAFFTGLASFLLAAFFIDAFESSKIAYYFWALFGLFINQTSSRQS